MKPVSYLQTDPKWANIDYSAKGEKTTIGKAGCGPTSAAMVIATWKDNKVTPKETAAWSLAHGYKACKQGTYYSYFEPQGKAYGITIKMINGSNLRDMSSAKAKPYHEKALAAIKAGNLVICCMGPGTWTKAGHFILWYGADGNTALINDPASTASARTKGNLATLQKEVKYYFVCYKPEAPKPDHTPSDWAKDSWAWAKEKGITDGTNPKSYITREQAITMIYRYLGHASAPIAEAWKWAVDNKYTDGSNPKYNCSREQFITFIYRITLSKPAAPIVEAWVWAKEKGITDGTNPTSACTREMVATILYRLAK